MDVWMYGCMYVCMYICIICLCTCIYAYRNTQVHLYIHMCKCNQITQLCNPTAGSGVPVWFRLGFQGRQEMAHHSQTQRLKPNSHCCWEHKISYIYIYIQLYTYIYISFWTFGLWRLSSRCNHLNS